MDKENYFYSNFLFADNGFLAGAGTVMNLGGKYFEYNTSENGDADSVAIKNDFDMVGQDICKAQEKFDIENAEYFL